MSANPDVTIDHAVLDLIEHSPIGAVPRTPAYSDALTRLSASRQVYPDADHREGFVTSRSLANRPSYFARNLEAFAAGAIAAAELESDASIFDRYLKELKPELAAKAREVRAMVVSRSAHHRMHAGVVAEEPVHSLILVPGTGPNRGVAGNYLYGKLLQLGADRSTCRWAVHVHDSGDRAMMIELATLPEAAAKVLEVVASAPFHLSELEALDFRSN